RARARDRHDGRRHAGPARRRAPGDLARAEARVLHAAPRARPRAHAAHRRAARRSRPRRHGPAHATRRPGFTRERALDPLPCARALLGPLRPDPAAPTPLPGSEAEGAMSIRCLVAMAAALLAAPAARAGWLGPWGTPVGSTFFDYPVATIPDG